ncbi:MAG: ribosome biogenesis GTPase YlqF [Pseudomonadales bacterium]|nr:ribosome biogenesis GTPase YlqF [Pseudomonadales bacterium]
MTISWYPGHMHKANKEMARVVKEVDILIEILDARMPHASSNPMLQKLRKDKPCLHILNKADLAEPAITAQWQQALASTPRDRALINSKDMKLQAADIIKQCQQLAQMAGLRKPRKQAMIIGIPNVGKSTLMNQIAGRKIARTGNEPAITKSQQRIRLGDDWYLVDTPGVLWPKFADQDTAYRLACAGAIRNTAMEFEEVALFAAEFLLRDFPHRLSKFYALESLPAQPEELLECIARKRGFLRNGNVDWHRIAELVLHDFRAGRLGPMSLERPIIESPTESPTPE